MNCSVSRHCSERRDRNASNHRRRRMNVRGERRNCNAPASRATPTAPSRHWDTSQRIRQRAPLHDDHEQRVAETFLSCTRRRSSAPSNKVRHVEPSWPPFLTSKGSPLRKTRHHTQGACCPMSRAHTSEKSGKRRPREPCNAHLGCSRLHQGTASPGSFSRIRRRVVEHAREPARCDGKSRRIVRCYDEQTNPLRGFFGLRTPNRSQGVFRPTPPPPYG
jgi:hypothetical protein